MKMINKNCYLLFFYLLFSKNIFATSIPLPNNIDYIKAYKDSSVEMLIKASAQYKSGTITKDKYIEIALQVSQVADYFNKVNLPTSPNTGIQAAQVVPANSKESTSPNIIVTVALGTEPAPLKVGTLLKQALDEAPMWAAEAARFPGPRKLGLMERLPLIDKFQGPEAADEKTKRAAYEAAQDVLFNAVMKGTEAEQAAALESNNKANKAWVPAFNAVCKQIAGCMYGYSEDYKDQNGDPAFGITLEDLANFKYR